MNTNAREAICALLAMLAVAAVYVGGAHLAEHIHANHCPNGCDWFWCPKYNGGVR